MIREAINRVIELSEIRAKEINGIIYTKDSISRVKPPEHISPDTMVFYNLQAIVDYIDQVDYEPEDLFFAINSPKSVSLNTKTNRYNDNQLFIFAEARMDLPDFGFGQWYPLEDFIINLLSRFEATSDRDDIIQMLANLANEHVIQNIDDKFSQTLQVKEGIVRKANVEVKNPVSLGPFRTFREIQQPESNFVLRYKNLKGDTGIAAALFEGDGGRWQLDAIALIKGWLISHSNIPVVG